MNVPVPRLKPQRGPDFSAFARADETEMREGRRALARPDFSGRAVQALDFSGNAITDEERRTSPIGLQAPPLAVTVGRAMTSALPFTGQARTRLTPEEQAAWTNDAEARRGRVLADREADTRALREIDPSEFRRLTGLYPEQFDGLGANDPERQRVLDRIRQERDRAGTRLSQAQSNMDEVNAIRAGQLPAAQFGPVQSAGAGAIQTFTNTLVSAPLKAAGAVQSSITGREPEETALYRQGEAISRGASELFPSDAVRRDEFGQQLAEGAGSAAGFASGGIAGRMAGLGKGASALLVGLQGAAAQGSSGLDEAIAADATTGQKLTAFYANAGLGLTEALPFNRFLGRVDDASGGMVARIARNTAAGSMDEFLQEVGQQVGSNVIAAQIARYDEDRSPGEGALEAGLVGAMLGGVGGAGSAVLSGSTANQTPLDFSGQARPETSSTVPSSALRGRAVPGPATNEGATAPDIETPVFTPLALQTPSVERSAPNGGYPQAGFQSASASDVTGEEQTFSASPQAARVTAPLNLAKPDFSSSATPQTRLNASPQVARLQGVRSRGEGGIAQRSEQTPATALKNIAANFNQRLGLTTREGRLQNPRALGEYNPGSGVIRTRVPEEMDVLSHEGGHALAFRYREAFNGLVSAQGDNLRALAYPGAKEEVRLDEGFAEFFRLYVTNPAYAEREAPGVFRAFEAIFNRAAPEEMAAIRDVQQAYNAWLETPSGESIAADIVSNGGQGGAIGRAFRSIRDKGLGGSILAAADRLYTATIDDLHPINRAVQDLTRIAERNKGRRVEGPAARNAYVLSRLARDAYAGGHMDIMHGIRPYKALEPQGPALSDALAMALGDRGFRRWDQVRIDAFGSYLVSRRALQEWRNYENGRIPNAPDKFTKGDHALNIEELEAAHPEFRRAAQMVYAWNNALWKKKFDAGLITREQYMGGLQQHADYVPFIREMGEERGRGGGARNNKTSTFQQFRGSRRAIINPVESMMRDAYQTAAVIARNDAIRALHDLSRMAGRDAGAIVEEVPATESRAIKVDAGEAFRSAAREAGMSERDVASIADAMDQALDGEMSATLFSAGVISERGEPIVFVWRNGRRHALRLADGQYGQDMFSALTGMGQEQSNVFTNLLAAPTQLLRYGITAHPEFVFTNYIRDQLSAWVLTDVGFKPFMTGARGIADEVNQSDITRVYNSFGGLMGGANVSALDQSRVDQDIQALRKKGYAIRRFGSWRGFAELTEVSETGTRLGLFRRAFERARKSGLGEYEAAIEAAYTARDYIDFGRHGSRMLMARRLVPFLNAAIQGLDKTTRVLSGGGSLRHVLAPLFQGQKPESLTRQDRDRLTLAVKAWGKIAVLGAFGLTLSALYADDPEYQEMSDYLRATHWMLKIDGEWVAIPKPFELAAISNILERGFEAAYRDDPQAGDRLVRGLAMTIVPPHSVPAITVPAEIAGNKSFFTGAPIVPEHLRGLEPHLQFNAYASEFGKTLGEAVGVSPSVIDHAITGFGGSWGRTLLEMSNRMRPGRPEMAAADTPVVGRFVRDFTRGATSTADFWEQMSRDGGELNRAHQTYRMLVRNGRFDEAAAYLAEQAPPAREFALINTYLDADRKRLHPMRRAYDIVGVIGDMRRELNTSELAVAGTESTIALTPARKREAIDVLSRLAVSEAGDALALSGINGYERRNREDRNALLEELRAASPEVHAEYMRRLQSANVAPSQAVEQAWPQLQGVVSGERFNAALPLLIRRERAQALQAQR